MLAFREMLALDRFLLLLSDNGDLLLVEIYNLGLSRHLEPLHAIMSLSFGGQIAIRFLPLLLL